ncbi:extensin-like [Anoplophora glabripennis]|uniref:extensin-like n=1 Tax=Anoplophora glabripennis TaxID=217634 RepID=UPI0008735560|nr:extensin-like [Anoplophora glabripennis]
MAAKFGLTIFVVLVATQVFPSSGSCIYPPPPCSLPAPCAPGGYVSGPAHGPVYLPGPSPVYVGSAGASAAGSVYYPGPAPSPDCSVPPVYLPPPKFPNLPTIHAPNPLTIPLQVPSVIPVGKVCVCKAIQIQPSVIPVQKPVSPKPLYLVNT